MGRITRMISKLKSLTEKILHMFSLDSIPLLNQDLDSMASFSLTIILMMHPRKYACDYILRIVLSGLIMSAFISHAKPLFV